MDRGTETVSETSANGNLLGGTVTTRSANGLSVTTDADHYGVGSFDTVTTDVTVINADGSRTETVTDHNSDGSERDQTVTVTSANGLSKTTTHDFDGNGAVDLTTSDVTVLNADGSRTLTVTDTNANGLRDTTATTTSADRRSVSTTRLNFGSVDTDQTETVVVQGDDSTVDTVSNLGTSGQLLNRTVTTTSANGLSKTVQTDVNGDGSIDLTTTDVTVLNGDGSRTQTVTNRNASGEISETVTTTSANGLSTMVQTDQNGDGVFDLTTSDVKTINADGSTTETVTDTNADGSQRDKSVTTVSADRRTQTINRFLGAGGMLAQTETISVGNAVARIVIGDRPREPVGRSRRDRLVRERAVGIQRRIVDRGRAVGIVRGRRLHRIAIGIGREGHGRRRPGRAVGFREGGLAVDRGAVREALVHRISVEVDRGDTRLRQGLDGGRAIGIRHHQLELREGRVTGIELAVMVRVEHILERLHVVLGGRVPIREDHLIGLRNLARVVRIDEQHGITRARPGGAVLVAVTGEVVEAVRR